MTDTPTLLSTLRERGVGLTVEGGSLKCSAPVGALDAEMRATLAARKQEILAYLTQAEIQKSLPSALVPIKPGGRRPPIFVVSGHGGDVFCLLGLARHLDPEQPVFGVRPPGLDGGEPLHSIAALARYEIEQIRRYRPEGPYLVAGHCAGGTVAFEVAQQLTAAGERIALLALIGSPFPTMFRPGPQTLAWLHRHARALTSGSLAERARYVATRLQKRLHLRPPDPVGLVENYAIHARENPALAVVSPAMLEARQRVEEATVAACRVYQPQRYAGRVDLFVTSDRWHGAHHWRAVADNIREHHLGEFEVDELLLGSHVAVLAAALQQTLDQVTVDPARGDPGAAYASAMR